ncbi:MFS transporter [Reinekea marinisedimentorum]|uniref:Putative MFS family arabinose efflux permease n=1 Tax=Reinekea marinisedimentorum TaxID=230495 RepID=A0A4R3I6A8_9GAMM|nr:MFS transporter [Reinekea marinisedimentorum]TCS40692.1 putative MFS family arabinose efflux permease [Reinekea marinisedimentorum]
MIPHLVPLAALLISDALVLLGHGLLLTLLPVSASLLGFSDLQIGLTGSGYFVGFVVGCFTTPIILKRVGHIRTFAVLAALYTVLILFFAWSQSFIGWMLLRFMIGAVISGIYMIIESWLNERADAKNRGSILSFYAMMNLAMITLAQQLLNLSNNNIPMLFTIAGIFLSLSIVPVSLTLTLAPAPVKKIHVNFSKVWKHSHIGILGSVFTGLITGSFWSLAPIYAKDSGLTTFQIANFMSAVVLGGAIFQIPLGRFSDRYDRRLILTFIALAGAIISAVIFVTSFQSFYAGAVSTGLAFLWGSVGMTMYAICLAHANDNADSADFVDIGSSMLITYGISSAIGAPVASAFMSVFGHEYLYVFMALSFASFCGVLIVRRKSHVLPVVATSNEDFQAVAGMTTQEAFVLDPRSDEQERHESDVEFTTEVVFSAEPDVEDEEETQAEPNVGDKTSGHDKPVP